MTAQTQTHLEILLEEIDRALTQHRSRRRSDPGERPWSSRYGEDDDG